MKLGEFKDRLGYVARPCQERERTERGEMRKKGKIGDRKEQWRPEVY